MIPQKDEAQKLMIQAEEQLSPKELVRLRAKITLVLWAKYRESEWRLPKFGAPGPGDEPPPMVSLRDLFE